MCACIRVAAENLYHTRTWVFTRYIAYYMALLHQIVRNHIKTKAYLDVHMRWKQKEIWWLLSGKSPPMFSYITLSHNTWSWSTKYQRNIGQLSLFLTLRFYFDNGKQLIRYYTIHRVNWHSDYKNQTCSLFERNVLISLTCSAEYIISSAERQNDLTVNDW